MTTIRFFAEEGCKGAFSEALTQDVSDLSSIGFAKRAKSLRVSGNPWVVFEEKDFLCKFELFREGDHNSLGDFSEDISSVRVVKGGLGDPEITVYVDANYKSKSATIKSATPNLESYDMDDKISSHKVTRGAWRLYANKDYKGACIVALAGDCVPNYECIHFSDIASSLKPY